MIKLKSEVVISMLIKTVVDETFEGSTIFESYCMTNDTGEFQKVKLWLAEKEYDDISVETFSREISEYYIHTTYTYDYESSSDAGDGRDEYYKEENDIQINLNECIIKNDHYYGVVCECFNKLGFLLLDCPETVIYHPGNYGGRNYHFYRHQRFKLIKKAVI